ncbi:hypothetical protein EELLY_v1c01660 [Entomoplasma ellychniae]|uniref:Uncharacterized protein n=1 Tax=Entomoplasma ellychniae TaxID=2114 RepID=A0A8E2UAF8_9MOLU|nr:hypothetical protein [Entomoplasma ellychniae]PPE04486.1 hypothetical protein EELLY_v1c01660 [Entomoplasma ellychniae]
MESIKIKLINDFEKKHIKKEQSSEIFDINFKWEYLSLFELCSKPKLLAYIKKIYKKDINWKTNNFVNESIDQIRTFLKSIDSAFWDYICLTNNSKLILNMYEEFLREIYSKSKKLVNNHFISMIICMNEGIEYTLNYENHPVIESFDTIFQDFKICFQKFILKRLKSINKNYPGIKILQLIISAYEEQLEII